MGIDITRIVIEKFTFENAVPFLGLKLTESNGQLRGPCPACKTGTLVVIPRNSFYCTSSLKEGDAVDLIGHVKGISMRKASQLFMAHFTFPHRLNEDIDELRAELRNVIDYMTVHREIRELTRVFHAVCMDYQRALKAMGDK